MPKKPVAKSMRVFASHQRDPVFLELGDLGDSVILAAIEPPGAPRKWRLG